MYWEYTSRIPRVDSISGKASADRSFGTAIKSILFHLQQHVDLNGLPASNSITSLRGGQIIDHENLLFIADISLLPAKLGSVFFTVKEDNDWGTLVSPEFQILLGEPNWDKKTTSTVFGHVVVGFNVLDRISKIHKANKSTLATVIDCGVI